LTRAAAFLSNRRPLDYGARLARLRWKRAARAGIVREWNAAAPAAEALASARDAESWIVVRDASALPLGNIPEPASGAVSRATPVDPPAVHTLRELESAVIGRSLERPSPAFLFRADCFHALGAETVETFLARLESEAKPNLGFMAVVFEDPSERERPELTRRLPGGRLRVLDAGCGAGGGIGLARARHPEWEVVGIERDADLAARARRRCDRVIEGDLTDALGLLAGTGERFDALVFADVLEHLEDPVAALTEARRLASPEAILLVSVPNAGHLSVVRDLLLGRHDSVAAGLCDVGHLRWFTRSFLEEAIAEAGWRLESLEAEGGAPAPDTRPFLGLAAQWPDADLPSLATYQWIATARAR